MFVTSAALAMVTVVLVWWLLQPRSRYQKALDNIPGPRPVPVFGNTLQLKTDTEGYFQQVVDWAHHYEGKSPVFKLMLGSLPLVHVFQAETAEQFLNSTKNITKSDPYRFLHPWLQTGLLTSHGTKWHSRRKLLTPTFHFRILTDFLVVFNEQASVLTDLLEEKCDSGPFDIFPFLSICALDIICETAMGKKIDAQKSGGNSEYVSAVSSMSVLFMKRFRSPWLWSDFIYNMIPSGKRHEECLEILHGFTGKVIKERMEELSGEAQPANTAQSTSKDEGLNRKRRVAFLDLLIQMSKEAGFTENDIQEEVDTFMFEGHDTTAAAMVWAIQLIGSHPEVQKKLHEEMDKIFGDSDRPATMADISNMKYLECVIKESLRLCPSVPQIGRLVEEDVDIDGMLIPKGACIIILIWKINRDPKWFADPEKFNPDRFSVDESSGRHPFAFVPFSAGPRNCIGQRFALIEEKTVLSAILRRYSIESQQTLEETRPIAEVILRPNDGIKVKLTTRSRGGGEEGQ